MNVYSTITLLPLPIVLSGLGNLQITFKLEAQYF